MEKQEIIDNNVLIAEFLGWSSRIWQVYQERPEQRIWFEPEKDFPSDYKTDNELYFHEDWNLLRPVVEKISEYRLAYPDQASLVCDCKIVIGIEQLYKKVVDFIKWYNSEERPR